MIARVESLAKAKSFDADALPKLRAIVVWDPDLKADAAASTISTADGRSIQVVHWRKLKHTSQAEAVSEADEAELDARIKAQQPGAACAYIYTSGTTGSPKAVMITHDNIVFEATSAHRAMVVGGLAFEDERIISYLPLSHVAGMLLDIVLPLFVAAMTPGSCACHFARNYDLKAASIVERFGAVRPTIFLGVPRVWEKIAEKMMAIKAKMIESGELKGAKLRLVGKSADMNVKHQYNCQLGGERRQAVPFIIAEKISAKAKYGSWARLRRPRSRRRPSRSRRRVLAGVGINIDPGVRHVGVHGRVHVVDGPRAPVGLVRLRDAGRRGQGLPLRRRRPEQEDGVPAGRRRQEPERGVSGRALLPRPQRHARIHGEPRPRPGPRRGDHRRRRPTRSTRKAGCTRATRAA